MSHDLRLHVERSGAGPCVVLLHGFTGSTRTWDALRAALEPQFTVIAVDLPGHAQSSAPPDPARYALPRFADDLARLLDDQDVSRCAVLGYSMGGRAALRFALAHPGRLSHLILESTQPGITDSAEREARRRRDLALADFLGREGLEAFVDQWEKLPMWVSQARLHTDAQARQRAIRHSHTVAGLANSLRGAGPAEDDPVLARLGEIRVPTLLIVGGMDKPYVEHARAMAAQLPQARLEVVSRAGHAVHLEKPKRYASLVKSFLLTQAH